MAALLDLQQQRVWQEEQRKEYRAKTYFDWVTSNRHTCKKSKVNTHHKRKKAKIKSKRK